MTAFSGFGPDALPFLKALAFHQNKEWFEANREVWERNLKTPLSELIVSLVAKLERDGLPFRGDPKTSAFRINRDVRFSKDKSPYKATTSCVLTRSGSKGDPGVLYVHIDPQGCFMAAGFHHVEPAALTRMRRAIARAPKPFLAMVAALAKQKLALSQSEALTRLPRGFETIDDPAIAEAIKRKSFVCRRPIADAAIGSASLVDDIGEFAGRAMPLLEWGWAAIVDER